MKMSFSHKNPILMVSGILIVISILIVLFTTCDIGLGQIVNTEKPVINTAGDNPPGTFLRGKDNRIALDVSNKLGFKIVEVWMDVDYTDAVTGQPATKRVDAQQDPETGEWYVILDTTDMEDGKIIGKVTAKDESGNTTTTTEMVYNVKNTPPQIKLNMPLVDGDNWDDDDFLDKLQARDPLLLGFELLGLATDNLGIAEGFPQIMIWPKSELDREDKKIPVDPDTHVPLPPERGGSGEYGVWRSLVVPNAKDGLNATKFSWPMQRLIPDKDAPGGYRLPKNNEPRIYLGQDLYNIRIRTKDLFGEINEYPNRKDTTRADPSRKFITINYIASDIPTAQVTTYPQYYNAANDFVVDFLVSCTNELLPTNPVVAHIVDGRNGFEHELSAPYYPPQDPSNGSPYPFNLTIPAAEAKLWNNPSEGTLYLRLKATAKDDKDGPPTYQHFQYDITPPEVPIDRPVSLSNIKKTGTLDGGKYTILYPAPDTPKWVTGSITVGGINTDDNGIKDVYYHIGKLGDDFDSDNYWGVHYNDSSVWTDAKLNTSKPDEGWVGSPYAWTYTKTYPIGFKSGNSDIIQEYEELNGYPALDNSDTSGPEQERFYLPFYVKVVDNAKNFHIVHYKLCVAPLLDEPQVSIVYPKENDTVGGTLRISGSATDNYWMHTVLIRVKKDGESTYYIPQTTPATTLFYANPDNLSYPKPKVGGVEDTAGWFKATKNGDDVAVSWSSSINQDKGLNHPNPDLNQKVWIEAVAIDTNELTHQIPHITGPVSKIYVNFSSKVPTVDDSKIQKENLDPVELDAIGTKSSGKFKIILKVSAAEGFNIFKARINDLTSTDCNIVLNGYVQPLPTGWAITPLPDNGNRKCYQLTIDIDSTKTAMPQFPTAVDYGSTGNLKLELTLEDMTEQHFSTTGTYNIGIDNFSPKAKILTSKIATGNFLVEGTAQDYASGSGTIQGLERVLVYVEKAIITYTNNERNIEGSGNYLLPTGGTATPSSVFITYPNLVDTKINDGQIPNHPNFNTFPKLEKNASDVWTSPVALVIDNAENAPDKDYDIDGTFGEMWNGLIDKEWGARLDTTKFSDGPYILHYIVMDQAGNATHYQDDIFIENKKPLIRSINIGTDIDFNNEVTYPTEFRQNAYTIDLTSEGRGYQVTPPKEFRIRNNHFGLRLELTGGNVTKHVLVAYVEKSAVKPVTAMERGRVYEIADTAVDTDFRKYGAPNNYKGTVFVASGKGEGVGTVYQWESKSNDSYDYFTNRGGGEDLTTIVDFNKFDGVPDGNTVNFVVKVYDAALSIGIDGNPREYDQLGHAVLLTVAVSNTDTENPTINLADFGQKYVTETWIAGETRPGDPQNNADKKLQDLTASEYTVNVAVDTAGKKLGYVQYGKHNTPANATANISGKVTFTGIAADNHRIQKITVQISGYPNTGAGTETDIATWNGGLVPATDTDWKVSLPMEVPQLSLEYGHAVNWEFTWDSSKHSSVAANNVTVTFRVYDHASPNRVTTSAKTVNIVPYISEVKTPLSGAYSSAPSAFNRSALGGYPVRENDLITITGFNLGASITNAKINGTSLPTARPTVLTSGDTPSINTVNGVTTIISYVPADVNSGPLVVTVNSIDSFNNRSNRTKTSSSWNAPYVAEYNREPNNVNNNILDNSRYIYVWRTGYLHNERVLNSPFMRMRSDNATRYMTYGTYSGGSGHLYRRVNNTQTEIENSTNRYTNITLAVDEAGNYYGGTSNITAWANNQTGSFNFHSRDIVGTQQNNANGTNKRRLEYLYNGQTSVYDVDRVKIPRIVARRSNATIADNTPVRIFMSYYDSNSSDNAVVFRYGTVGSTADTIRGNISTNVAAANPGTAVNRQVLASSSTTTVQGSIYTAVGGLSTGRPVVAWYDRVNLKLYFNYGSALEANNTYNANVTATWLTTPFTVADGNKGLHVDMAVDQDDGVHLAYYDGANGGLWYTYIPNATTGGGGAPNTVNAVTVKVDTFLSAGTKLMINVRREGTRNVPYITYYHGSFTETKNSIRVAWQKNTTLGAGTDGNDMFTGAWEVMTVPVGTIPVSTEFICNGVPSATTGWANPTTGTGSFVAPTDTLNQSILVGYMTNDWYEGAILIGNMTTTPPELQK